MSKLITQWQDAQERWEAQLRLWAIEDQGGYLEAVQWDIERFIADHAPVALHNVWGALGNDKAQ